MLGKKSQTLGILLGFAFVTNNCKCSEKISRKQNQKAESTHGSLQWKEIKILDIRWLQLQNHTFNRFIHKYSEFDIFYHFSVMMLERSLKITLTCHSLHSGSWTILNREILFQSCQNCMRHRTTFSVHQDIHKKWWYCSYGISYAVPFSKLCFF